MLYNQAMELKKLNIGCGNNILPGWVNLDVSALPGVDVVCDIEKLPLPFADEQFDEILCQDVLEHVEYIPILRDILRIMKKGASLNIRVPHFTSKFNAMDPTHKKTFSINTFDFFVKGSSEQDSRGYYFDFAFSSCREAKIVFEKDLKVFIFVSVLFFLINPLLFLFSILTEKLVNFSPRLQKVYESTFLSRLFPACNLLITLVK